MTRTKLSSRKKRNSTTNRRASRKSGKTSRRRVSRKSGKRSKRRVSRKSGKRSKRRVSKSSKRRNSRKSRRIDLESVEEVERRKTSPKRTREYEKRHRYIPQYVEQYYEPIQRYVQSIPQPIQRYVQSIPQPNSRYPEPIPRYVRPSEETEPNPFYPPYDMREWYVPQYAQQVVPQPIVVPPTKVVPQPIVVPPTKVVPQPIVVPQQVVPQPTQPIIVGGVKYTIYVKSGCPFCEQSVLLFKSKNIEPTIINKDDDGKLKECNDLLQKCGRTDHTTWPRIFKQTGDDIVFIGGNADLHKMYGLDPTKK
jgi:glutaredoxin